MKQLIPFPCNTASPSTEVKPCCLCHVFFTLCPFHWGQTLLPVPCVFYTLSFLWGQTLLPCVFYTDLSLTSNPATIRFLHRHSGLSSEAKPCCHLVFILCPSYEFKPYCHLVFTLCPFSEVSCFFTLCTSSVNWFLHPVLPLSPNPVVILFFHSVLPLRPNPVVILLLHSVLPLLPYDFYTLIISLEISFLFWQK